jgi:predicted GIY-YIG superfamily endonuclease
MFGNGSGRNEQSQQRTFHRCFLQSFGSFGQTVSEEKNLKNQPIRNKNRLWRPCLLTDRDGLGNLYRGTSIDASYQVSDHLAKRFQRRRFLEIDQSETRIAYDGHVCKQIKTE